MGNVISKILQSRVAVRAFAGLLMVGLSATGWLTDGALPGLTPEQTDGLLGMLVLIILALVFRDDAIAEQDNKAVQEVMREAGAYKGKIDGQLKEKSYAAARKMERAYKMVHPQDAKKRPGHPARRR